MPSIQSLYLGYFIHDKFREDMITKLKNVMGIEDHQLHDPDDSYVLTVDNVMKMLAIHMRFRYLRAIVHNIHLYNYDCTLLLGATFLS